MGKGREEHLCGILQGDNSSLSSKRHPGHKVTVCFWEKGDGGGKVNSMTSRCVT